MVVAAFIIGIVALVVAMLAIPQMIWGKPQITVSWGIDDNTLGGKVLECRIWNEPLSGKLSKFLFVWRRPIEDLTAMFDVSEYGSGQIKISHHIPKIRDFTGTYAQRTRLPASWVHASFGIVYIKDGEKIIKLFKESSQITFDIGRYRVLVTVIADNKAIKSEATFEVSEDSPYLIWRG